MTWSGGRAFVVCCFRMAIKGPSCRMAAVFEYGNWWHMDWADYMRDEAGRQLAEAAKHVLENRQPIPPPSSFDVKMLAPDYRNAMLVLVPLQLPDTTAQRRVNSPAV